MLSQDYFRKIDTTFVPNKQKFFTKSKVVLNNRTITVSPERKEGKSVSHLIKLSAKDISRGLQIKFCTSV